MTSHYSKIIQGCMTWGVWGKNFTVEEMAHKISESVELGITTFDHADIYGDYTTESTFGKAFKTTAVNRGAIQLISKCGIQLHNKDRKTYAKHYNYTKDYIITQAEQSLQNLKTDYLDLFLLHRPSPLMPIDDIKEAITQLKNDGKIKSFGVSNFTPQQIEYLKDDLKISVNQIQCSISHYSPFEDDSLLYHQKQGIVTMGWSPLGNIFSSSENSTLSICFNKLTIKYNCSKSQLALAWLLHHPSSIYPVLGTTQTSRIKEAKASLTIKLDIQDWFMLYEASRHKEVD